MKTKLGWYLVAGAMAIPALAGYGKDDTQIMFAFGGGANNARLYAEVLAQAERDRPGKPVVGLADRLAGHSAGAMLAEADGGKAGPESGSACATVETKADGESKAATKS